MVRTGHVCDFYYHGGDIWTPRCIKTSIHTLISHVSMCCQNNVISESHHYTPFVTHLAISAFLCTSRKYLAGLMNVYLDVTAGERGQRSAGVSAFSDTFNEVQKLKSYYI